MNRRTTLTLMTMALLAVVSATALTQIGFAQSNSIVGTWKVNLAKSTYSPGPPPRSQTLSYEAVGQGIRVTADGIDAQGNPTKVVFGPFFFDGKPYPVTGTAAFDASSYKIVNDSTVEATRTKAGKVVQTLTRVLSADGTTLTNTSTGVGATGQQINNVAVFDKQ
jgi:hypothetical protein